MLELEPKFRRVRQLDGYLRLEDLGVIGDGATVALVGADGSIPWLCVPAFDAEPLFCALLDPAKGGQFSLMPEGLLDARQRYETDTGVLITEFTVSGVSWVIPGSCSPGPLHRRAAEGLCSSSATILAPPCCDVKNR